METKEQTKVLGITEGCFIAKENLSLLDIVEIISEEKGVIAHVFGGPEPVIIEEEERDANAEVMADALNTFNKCKAKSSELLQQRNELLGALQDSNIEIMKILKQGIEGSFPLRSLYDKNYALIAKALNQ